MLMNKSLSRTFSSKRMGEAYYKSADVQLATNNLNRQTSITSRERTREIQLQNKTLAQNLQKVSDRQNPFHVKSKHEQLATAQMQRCNTLVNFDEITQSAHDLFRKNARITKMVRARKKDLKLDEENQRLYQRLKAVKSQFITNSKGEQSEQTRNNHNTSILKKDSSIMRGGTVFSTRAVNFNTARD